MENNLCDNLTGGQSLRNIAVLALPLLHLLLDGPPARDRRRLGPQLAEVGRAAILQNRAKAHFLLKKPIQKDIFQVDRNKTVITLEGKTVHVQPPTHCMRASETGVIE